MTLWTAARSTAALTACLSAILVLLGCGSTTATAPEPSGSFFLNGDVRLAYTLDLPQGQGAGPFPAVVVGHGSGRVTRQQMAWFSNQWTAQGFAALRFDKRGVGESSGTYAEVPTQTSGTLIPLLASDIAAAVRFLRGRSEIDARRIGLAGVSQAGWILPHAARDLGGVPFMVLLSGPVCSVGLENYYSALAEGTSRPLDEVYGLLPAFNGFQGYDPVPVLQAIDVPALWLLGEDDRSIPVRTSVANLSSLSASGRPYEWRLYPGLGHNLSQSVWPDITAWAERFKR
jgi:dienelactone hydrolase